MAQPRKLFVTAGQRFGRGVVIDPEVRVTSSSGRTWRGARLRCDCGTEYEIGLSDLVRGHKQSCGCQRREWLPSHAREAFAAWRESPENAEHLTRVRDMERLHQLARSAENAEHLRQLARRPEIEEGKRRRGRSPENLEHLERIRQLPLRMERLVRWARSRENAEHLERLAEKWSRTPEGRERMRQVGSSPENLERLARLRRSPEFQEEVARWNRSPENLERLARLARSPQNRKRMAEMCRQFWSVPRVGQDHEPLLPTDEEECPYCGRMIQWEKFEGHVTREQRKQGISA
jgi:hypothetical protein